MVIVHVVPTLNRGGTERQMLDLALLQKENGHKVSIVSLSSMNHYQDETKDFDTYVASTKVQRSLTKKSIIEIGEYKKLIDNINPDVVHSHSYPSDLVVYQYIKAGIKYVSHHHVKSDILINLTELILLSKKQLAQWLDKWLLLWQYMKANSEIICVSADHEKFLKQKMPFFLHKHIHLIHNSIDSSRYIKRENKGSNSKLRLVSVGSLYPLKNHQLQTRIISELIKNSQDCELDIYGSGPYEKQLKELVKDQKLEKNIRFKGNCNKIPQILKDYDLFIHTSLQETFGLAILEALAAGLPVVCLDAGGNRDLIHNGINGFIIKEDNPTRFKEAFEHVLKNYEQMSNAARKSALAFSNESHFEKVMQLYS